MRHPNRLDWCWLLGECASALVVIVMVCVTVVYLTGCASTMHVTQEAHPENQGKSLTCDVVGEMNTGTEVLCSKSGIIIRRNSATPAITGAVEAAVKTFMHGGF